MASEMRAKAHDRAAQWGPVAALHALILAMLARILLRLETMIHLWQQGLLPPHSSRPPAPTHPHDRARPSTHRPPETRRTPTQAAPIPLTQAGHTPVPAARGPATPGLAHAPAGRRGPPSSAMHHRCVAWPRLRAPPSLQNAVEPAPPTRAFNVTKS